MKIVFLGDSLTWGGYGGNFVAVVQELLPDQEIINAGEGGNTVLNLLRRVDTVLAQEPDGVFVMVGGNDAISYCYPDTRPYYEQVQKIPGGTVTPEAFGQAYRELLTRLHSHHILTWVGLQASEYSPAMVQMLAQYNNIAREIAQSLKIDELDFAVQLTPDEIPERPPLDLARINLIGRHTREGWSDYQSARAEGGYSFSFDGSHLMPQTARQMAQMIVDFLDLN